MERVHKVSSVRETEEAEEVNGMVLVARVVHYIFGVIIAFIMLRFILLLLGANTGNVFVDFIYNVSGIFVAPFYGIFNNTPVFGRSIIDVSSIVAVVVYALLSWAIGALVTLGLRRRDDVV